VRYFPFPICSFDEFAVSFRKFNSIIPLEIEVQIKTKVTLRPTVSRPVYLGIKHPSGGRRPDFYYCQTVVGFWTCGVLSDERTGLSFTIAAGLLQRSRSRVPVPQDSLLILLSQVRDSLNQEDQVPVFVSPRNRVDQLYHQTLGSLLASCNSQGYGGVMRTRLHTAT
jgi:hypothetical protein